jgi:hypothetical protein
MSANLYCWTPELALTPKEPALHEEIGKLMGEPKPAPSAKLIALVDELLKQFPDLTVSDDTVWAAGPLREEIVGQFINIAIVWSRYEEARRFIIWMANRHGLNCYDPQDGQFFPTSTRPN